MGEGTAKKIPCLHSFLDLLSDVVIAPWACWKADQELDLTTEVKPHISSEVRKSLLFV